MGRRQKQQRNRRREEIGGKAETAGSGRKFRAMPQYGAARRKKDAADKQCQQYELNIIPL